MGDAFRHFGLLRNHDDSDDKYTHTRVYIYHLSHRGAKEVQSDETRPPLCFLLYHLNILIQVNI